MAYLVNVTARAGRDLAHLYRGINAEQSDAALKWYRGFREAILSLEELPNRCPVTPENDKLRHLLYGSKPDIYQAICRILEKEKQVEVLHTRHENLDDFLERYPPDVLTASRHARRIIGSAAWTHTNPSAMASFAR